MKQIQDLYNLLKLETSKLYLPKWVVADRAPETLKDVIQHYQESKEIKVWSGASDNTIWSKEGNWLFRAWHDYAHILTLGEFNKVGELEVMLKQQSQVDSSIMHKILEVEIKGQFDHQQLTGLFPNNQVEFFINNMKGL